MGNDALDGCIIQVVAYKLVVLCPLYMFGIMSRYNSIFASNLYPSATHSGIGSQCYIGIQEQPRGGYQNSTLQQILSLLDPTLGPTEIHRVAKL